MEAVERWLCLSQSLLISVPKVGSILSGIIEEIRDLVDALPKGTSGRRRCKRQNPITGTEFMSLSFPGPEKKAKAVAPVVGCMPLHICCPRTHSYTCRDTEAKA